MRCAGSLRQMKEFSSHARCTSVLRGKYVSLERECSDPAKCMNIGHLYVYKAGSEIVCLILCLSIHSSKR